MDAIVVASVEPNSIRLFVEGGSVRVSQPATRGKETAARDARAGEFWSRTGERPIVVEPRPPAPFVAAMPRAMRDALPLLASRYATASPPPPPGAEVTFDEAEPWLVGPYRRTFVRRLTPRLADPAFRGAVEARIAAYPEWDRVLHPQKYSADNAGPSK
jgi:hypothetical protein